MVETGQVASRLARQVESVPQLLRKLRHAAGAQPLAAPDVVAAIMVGVERAA
jgi:phosphoglucosamine mutase